MEVVRIATAVKQERRAERHRPVKGRRLERGDRHGGRGRSRVQALPRRASGAITS
jgi:hypothetical protein